MLMMFIHTTTLLCQQKGRPQFGVASPTAHVLAKEATNFTTQGQPFSVEVDHGPSTAACSVYLPSASGTHTLTPPTIYELV